MKKIIVFVTAFTLLFSSVSYGATFGDGIASIPIPDDPSVYLTMEQVCDEFSTNSTKSFDHRFVNTLVYAAENFTGVDLPTDYVTFFHYPDGSGITTSGKIDFLNTVPYLLISNSPMRLVEEKGSDYYNLVGTFDSPVYRLLFSKSSSGVWSVIAGRMSSDRAVLAKITNIGVTDFGTFAYANYDIPTLTIDHLKSTATKGFARNYEKYTNGSVSPSRYYDTSIPAPKDLKFTSMSSGGFLGIGASYKHQLSWSNTFSEELKTRISVQYKYSTSDSLPGYADKLLTDSFPASTGVYTQSLDSIKDMLFQDSFSRLDALNQYRVQFYKVVDGVEYVGPVGVVHLNKSFLGAYTGSTVTTEYPIDPEAPEDGMDSFGDSWTSDGSDYKEYDKDGNEVGSGTSDGGITGSGDPLTWLVKQFNKIPQLFTSFFTSLQALFSGVGEVPAMLARLFVFLPPDIITVLMVGLTVVVLLRILGR